MKKTFQITMNLDFGVLGLKDALIHFTMKSQGDYIETKVDTIEIMLGNDVLDLTNVITKKEMDLLEANLFDIYYDDFKDKADFYRDRQELI